MRGSRELPSSPFEKPSKHLPTEVYESYLASNYQMVLVKNSKQKLSREKIDQQTSEFLKACQVPTELVERARKSPVITRMEPGELIQFPRELLYMEVVRSIQSQQAIEKWYEASREVSRTVVGSDSIYNYCLGDLHFGHISTDYWEIQRLRDKILANPRAVVTLYGDEIEGFTQRHITTVVTQSIYDFRKQLELFRELFLRPLADANKIVCMVSNYLGHPGWGITEQTSDTWRLMVDGLGIPLVASGGAAVLRWGKGKNAPSQRLLLTHDPGRSSKIDPLYGIREIANLFPNDHPERPDAVGGAHVHKKSVGQELSMNPPHEKPRVLTLTLTGTAKSSNPDLPSDRHTTMFLRRPLNDPLGTGLIQGVVYEKGKKKSAYTYPVASFTTGDRASFALHIHERAQQQKITEELINTIHRRIEAAPSIYLVRNEAHEISMPHDEASPDANHRGKQAPQYDQAAWKIITQLPIYVEMIAHTRFGSESFQQFRPFLEKEVERLAQEPHSFAILGRHISDPDVATSEDRAEKLEDIVNFFEPLSANRKILALMLSGSLRTKSWKKTLGGGTVAPMRPGTYLSNNLKTPLLHHRSILELGVGVEKDRPSYVIALVDHLDGGGSTGSPVRGLSRMYWEDPNIRPDIYVGGHNPKVSWMIRTDDYNLNTKLPAFLQPGWWSHWQERGKSNTRYGSPGGQGFVLTPDQKEVYPTPTIEYSIMMHQAFTLLIGLSKLNMVDKVISRSKR